MPVGYAEARGGSQGMGVGALSKQPSGLFVASDRRSCAPRRELRTSPSLAALFFPYSFRAYEKNMAVGDSYNNRRTAKVGRRPAKPL